MDISSDHTKSTGRSLVSAVASVPTALIRRVRSWAVAAKNVGEDDPGRIAHAFKVGLAILAVSAFYYINPLYQNLGDSTVWAVMTVVVILEYTVGATLGKGLNRMTATLFGGGLGALVHHLGILCGKTGQAVLLFGFIFVVAVLFTFLRFFPKLKPKFDYGLMIFILTFSLVSVYGIRGNKDLVNVVTKRIGTIIMGSCIAIVISICVYPVWSGVQLHKLIASNLDKLGTFLEGFGEECFNKIEEKKGASTDQGGDKSHLQKYKSVLNTKSNEETMANLAAWEPSHGRFKFRHPWKQYLKIGTLIRQCAYKIDTLATYINNSDTQTGPEVRDLIKDHCMTLSRESGKTLKELSRSIKRMQVTASSLSAGKHVQKTRDEAGELNMFLQTTAFNMEDMNLSDLLPLATVASLLVEIATCTAEIASAVHELSMSACFKIDQDNTTGRHHHLVVVAPCDDDSVHDNHQTKEEAKKQEEEEQQQQGRGKPVARSTSTSLTSEDDDDQNVGCRDTRDHIVINIVALNNDSEEGNLNKLEDKTPPPRPPLPPSSGVTVLTAEQGKDHIRDTKDLN